MAELDQSLDRAIREHVLRVLKDSGGSPTVARRKLGVGRTTLYRWLREWKRDDRAHTTAHTTAKIEDKGE